MEELVAEVVVFILELVFGAIGALWDSRKVKKEKGPKSPAKPAARPCGQWCTCAACNKVG